MSCDCCLHIGGPTLLSCFIYFSTKHPVDCCVCFSRHYTNNTRHIQQLTPKYLIDCSVEFPLIIISTLGGATLYTSSPVDSSIHFHYNLIDEYTLRSPTSESNFFHEEHKTRHSFNQLGQLCLESPERMVVLKMLIQKIGQFEE